MPLISAFAPVPPPELSLFEKYNCPKSPAAFTKCPLIDAIPVLLPGLPVCCLGPNTTLPSTSNFVLDTAPSVPMATDPPDVMRTLSTGKPYHYPLI